MGLDYLAFITEVKKAATQSTVIDGVQMIIIAQMLGRNVTIVAPDSVWSSDSSMVPDIVIIYTGVPLKQFYPTQVGN